MEGEKKNKSTILIIVLCILLCCVSAYVVYDKLFSDNTSVAVPNNTEKDTSNTSNAITEEKVMQIYNDGIKTYLNQSERELLYDSESFSREEDKVEWIMGTKANEYLEGIGDYCGTDLEKKLINEGIIGEKNDGQLDCESVSFIKADSVINAVKKTFGEDAIFYINKLNDSKLYPYLEKQNLIFSYRAGMAAPVTEKYLGYSVNENILTIKFSITDYENNTSNYEAKYQIDGDNTYIKYINKI